MKRRNPIDNPVAPQTQREAVTAGNVDTSSTYREGICPECARAMVLTDIGGIPTYACLDHRIALPVRNTQ